MMYLCILCRQNDIFFCHCLLEQLIKLFLKGLWAAYFPNSFKVSLEEKFQYLIAVVAFCYVGNVV